MKRASFDLPNRMSKRYTYSMTLGQAIVSKSPTPD